MGIYSNAYLIYGVPCNAIDEDTGDCHPLYNDAKGDWDVSSKASFTLESYGHYEDPDNDRFILSPKGVERYSGDSWTPCKITAAELKDVAVYAANAEQERRDVYPELPSLHDAAWYLVASVG